MLIPLGADGEGRSAVLLTRTSRSADEVLRQHARKRFDLMEHNDN
jgi:hypothetical protein